MGDCSRSVGERSWRWFLRQSDDRTNEPPRVALDWTSLSVRVLLFVPVIILINAGIRCRPDFREWEGASNVMSSFADGCLRTPEACPTPKLRGQAAAFIRRYGVQGGTTGRYSHKVERDATYAGVVVRTVRPRFVNVVLRCRNRGAAIVPVEITRIEEL